MWFKGFARALPVALTLTLGAGIAAQADEHRDFHDHDFHHGGPARPGFRHGAAVHDFRGHDFAHFTVAEHDMWVRGAWHHEWHDGRFGWWWAAGGLWYFYAAPVYPYPTDVADVIYQPAEPMPAPPVAPAAGPPAGYWYYCGPSGAYYPYVRTCAEQWTVVPAAPTQ